MKFNLAVTLDLPEHYQGRKPEDTVLWVLHSFEDFCARFAGSTYLVELLGSAAVARLHSAPVGFDCTCDSDPLGRCVVHPKSAPPPLKQTLHFYRFGPLYVVVGGGFALGWGKAIANYIIRQGT